jgi:hypothetical protein
VTEVKELLEAQVPVRVGVEPDWADVLRRAKPRARLRRSRVLVPVLVLLGLVVTGVAIAAAVGGIPWWESAPPPDNPGIVNFELAKDVDSSFPPDPDSTRARTVAQDGGASLVAAPVGDDGYCLVLFLPGQLGSEGHNCEYQATTYIRSYARLPLNGSPAGWAVYGRIVDPKAAAFDLTGAAGFPLVIPLHHSGFFVASVSRDRWESLSYRAGPARVLDHSGATLRTECFAWGPAPGDDAPSGDYDSLAKPPCHFNVMYYPWLIDVRDATKLVELTLRLGSDAYETAPGQWAGTAPSIAIWRAPQEDGSVCILHALASPRPNAAHSPTSSRPLGPNPFTGWDCRTWESLQATRDGAPIQVSIGARQGSGPADWQFDGHVNPDSGIADLELQHPSTGDVRFAYANGWLLGQLPTSDAWKTFPKGGPFVLVGYDSDGREVARVDLEDVWLAEKKQLKLDRQAG